MSNINKNVDRMISKILLEEIEKKSQEMSEKLSKKQSKFLDVAEPKGKLTSADFKKLRSGKSKKSEEKESWGAIARAAVPMVASYIGSKMGENNEETELSEGGYYDSMTQWSQDDYENWLYSKGLKYVDDGKGGYSVEEINPKSNSDFEDAKPKEKESFISKLKNKIFGKKEETDEEVEEGNAFTGMLKKTKKGDKFKLGGKEYTDKSKLEENRNTLKLNENELIDLIENIVVDEKKNKNNIEKKQSTGLSKTEKVLSKNKKENDDYISSLTKKMKEYLKDGSNGNFEMNPTKFPKGNGQLKKMDRKGYVASDAVEEYIEDFARSGGLDDIHYDEIKPNEEWLEMNLEGSSKTGNSDEYANAEKTDLGKKLNTRRKKNPYNTEKRKGSYNRVKQPIDNAGESAGEKSVKNMFKKLEESKQEKMLKEEFNKISNLMAYNRKTQ